MKDNVCMSAVKPAVTATNKYFESVNLSVAETIT